MTPCMGQVMTMAFTTIGSAAGYGTLGRWLLLAVTLICWTAQFASMSMTCKTAKVPRFVSYGSTFVFYASHFPPASTKYAAFRRSQRGCVINFLALLSVIWQTRSNTDRIMTLGLDLLSLRSNPKVNNYVVVL
ncbi:hypothetical protein H4582DRAFT_2064387 [Lactarius indigo]|nr:hypothetical protein H4582DRAFT_2064387 [Lactarius indigo]